MIKKISTKKLRNKRLENCEEVLKISASKSRGSTPTKAALIPNWPQYASSFLKSVYKPTSNKNPSSQNSKLSIIHTPKKSPVASGHKKTSPNRKKTSKIGLTTDQSMKSFEKLYRISPSSSPISNRSFVSSSRDQMSTRSNIENYSENRGLTKENEMMFGKRNSEVCSLQYILDDHRNNVSCVDIEGEVLYTGASDYHVKKWKFSSTDPHPYRGKDYIEGEIFKNADIVAKHKRAVKVVKVKNNTLFTASTDGNLKIHKSHSGLTNLSLKSSVLSLEIFSNFVISCNHEEVIKIDTNTLQISTISNEKQSRVIEKASESTYYIGYNNGRLKLWDIRAYQFSANILAHRDCTSGVCVKDYYVYTCGQDGFLKLWDMRNLKIISNFNSNGNLSGVACGKNIVATGGDAFRIWTGENPIVVCEDPCKAIKITQNSILTAIRTKVFVWNVII